MSGDMQCSDECPVCKAVIKGPYSKHAAMMKEHAKTHKQTPPPSREEARLVRDLCPKPGEGIDGVSFTMSGPGTEPKTVVLTTDTRKRINRMLKPTPATKPEKEESMVQQVFPEMAARVEDQNAAFDAMVDAEKEVDDLTKSLKKASDRLKERKNALYTIIKELRDRSNANTETGEAAA